MSEPSSRQNFAEFEIAFGSRACHLKLIDNSLFLATAPSIRKDRVSSICKDVEQRAEHFRNLQHLETTLRVRSITQEYPWTSEHEYPDDSGALFECKILKECLKLYLHWYEGCILHLFLVPI
jgi:hypothetical protein